MQRRYLVGFVLLGAIVSSTGCAADTVVGVSPCMTSSPPAACMQTCAAAAAPCPTGFYCASTGRCNADCGATAATACAAGLMCRASDGRCLPTGSDAGTPVDGMMSGFDGTFPDDNICADVMLGGTLTTPNVILLVDRSGSMNNDFDMGMSRWDILQDAILTSVVTPLQHTVRFGLALFTGSDMGGTCPDLITVLPPALDNLGPIRTTYTGASPGSNTPTGESMAALVTILDGMTLPTGPTFIILATDGEPNTCADRRDTTGGQMMSVAAAAAARASGYEVDAIGVSTDVALANLTLVAAAGGGDAYSVSNTTDLVAALNTIIGGAVSCDITLSGMIQPGSECAGTVMIDGVPLGCEDPNGYHVVDATHIVLQGTACTQVMTSGGTITGRFPCGTVVLI